jgi:hypothetical protein
VGDWTDYLSAGAKYAVVVFEADAASTTELIAGGGFDWGIGLQDTGNGPELMGYSYDGGFGITTPTLPIALGTVYVAELLHLDGWLILRVFDDVLEHRTVSIPAPATVVGGGSMHVGWFNGRVAHFETYGARGAVPPQAERDALAVELAVRFTDAELPSGPGLPFTTQGGTSLTTQGGTPLETQ